MLSARVALEEEAQQHRAEKERESRSENYAPLRSCTLKTFDTTSQVPPLDLNLRASPGTLNSNRYRHRFRLHSTRRTPLSTQEDSQDVANLYLNCVPRPWTCQCR